MNRRQLLQETVSVLEECVEFLARKFERPILTAHGFRHHHRQMNDILASLLKGVRIVSALNASLTLLRAGYVQEVYVLCRVIGEFCEDIWFLSSPHGQSGEPSRDQIRFLQDFFQEEFDNPGDPLGSPQIRDRVPRRKIQAALSRHPGHGSNPSDVQEVQRTLFGAFSGYVHGAYPHIMDLYGGSPPRFHTSGMSDTPRIEEAETQLVHYIYRSLIAVRVVASRTSQPAVEKRLSDLSIQFAEQTGCNPDG